MPPFEATWINEFRCASLLTSGHPVPSSEAPGRSGPVGPSGKLTSGTGYGANPKPEAGPGAATPPGENGDDDTGFCSVGAQLSGLSGKSVGRIREAAPAKSC